MIKQCYMAKHYNVYVCFLSQQTKTENKNRKQKLKTKTENKN